MGDHFSSGTTAPAALLAEETLEADSVEEKCGEGW